MKIKKKTFTIKPGSFSSVGSVRSINQDSLFSAVNGESGLFAVADGMGGHYHGEIASCMLTEAFSEWWSTFIVSFPDFMTCYEDIKKVINDVNEKIYEDFSSRDMLCGTTISLLFIHEGNVMIADVGDTHIYKTASRGLMLESTDHTEKSNDEHGKLTSAVGCCKSFSMSIKTAPVEKCSYLICSDGVYKHCSEKDMVRLLKIKNFSEFREKLCGIVDEAGASDNYSFIRIDIS